MSRNLVKPAVLALMQPGVGYSSTGIAKSIQTTRAVTAQCLRRLIAEQRVVSVPIGRDHLYFSSAAGAAAFTQEQALEFAQQQAAQRWASILRAKLARGVATRARNAVVPRRAGVAPGVTLRAAAAVESPDLTGLPVTRAPLSDVTQRWHLLTLPDDPRWPSLASMGIGRYDDKRPAAWLAPSP